MGLRSRLFQGDSALEACLTHDASHVTPGSVGAHVGKIQTALGMIDGVSVDPGEASVHRYGPSTAARVLAFKQRHAIVNRSYQTHADNIVGKMTIAALDAEVRAKEGPLPPVLLLAFGIVPPVARDVVISVKDGQANRWAQQFIARQPARRAGVIVPRHPTVAQAAASIKQAIQLAGPGGMVIFNVGHGGVAASGNPADGTAEIAPDGTMTLGGANVINTFVNVFYDFNLAGPGGHSQQENDKLFNAGTPGAATRAANFAVYQDIATTFKRIGTSWVVFLTCNVGNAPLFLKKVANDWGVVVGAYLVRVALQQQPSGRVRMFLFTDPPGRDTNQPIGEEEIPLATGFNSVRVGPPLQTTP